MALRMKRRGLLARLGRAVLAEGARLWHDFPEIRPRHALLADRTGRTSERRAARSCSLILTAIPSPPRMLRARDRRGPVVILPGTRGVAPGSDEMPNTARRDSARRIGEREKKMRCARTHHVFGFPFVPLGPAVPVSIQGREQQASAPPRSARGHGLALREPAAVRDAPSRSPAD